MPLRKQRWNAGFSLEKYLYEQVYDRNKRLKTFRNKTNFVERSTGLGFVLWCTARLQVGLGALLFAQKKR